MLTLLLLTALTRPLRTGWFETPARWLPAHAVSAEALVARANDARVVALTDATHGTHEFFAAKQQLIAMLAGAGFRTIAFEAPYAEWERGEYAVGDYYFWYCDEILDLIAWAKVQSPPVRIAGIDSAHPIPAVDLLIERVRAVDPSLADDITTRYACLTEFRANPNRYSTLAQTDRNVCRASVLSVRPLLHDEELAHAARVVEQGEESLAGGYANRDAAMAENLEWLAQRDGKVIVIGHNEHFGRTPYSLFGGAPIASVGQLVSEHLPYFAVGSLALKGSFSTYDEGRIVAQQIPAATSDDYVAFFRESGVTSMFIPLDGPTPAWLSAPHRVRIAGSSGPMLSLVEELAKKFDAVLYVETSTPSRVR